MSRHSGSSSSSTPLLRRRPLAWILAWRYLRGRRSRILGATAAAALVATTLGVTAMVVALALMSGYTQDLQRKLIGLQGEVLVLPSLRDADAEGAARAAESVPGVTRAGLVAYGEGSVASPARPDGRSVVLRGVEPESLRDVARRARLDAVETPFRPGGEGRRLPGVVLGSQLLAELEVERGDAIRLVVLSGGPDDVRFRYRSVRVGGTFTTGFADFDARWALLDRELLSELRDGLGMDAVELALAPEADVEDVSDEVQTALGDAWLVQRWTALNRDLFAALELQERLLFLVLGLIVLVSTFNVASTLVILVRERSSDIGVLAALGLEPRILWWTFVGYGLALGAVGTALGLAVGAGASWVITEFELIRFDPEVAEIYFIASVPFEVELGDLAMVTTFSLVVTFLACALPAWRASRLGPTDALRSE